MLLTWKLVPAKGMKTTVARCMRLCMKTSQSNIH